MILSIHQPSYFPWLGLLDKIRKSDAFIVMDEVQLSDSAYQHRNLFLTSQGEVKFLTIPFEKKDYLKRRIRDIAIASLDWKTKHLNFLWNSYRKHPYVAEIMPRLEQYYAADYRLLFEAVLESMRLSFDFLGIHARVILQSEMQYDRSLRRGDLVLALVRAAGADCYLSGQGAKSYLDEQAFTGGLSIRYNDYRHPIYPQKGRAEFASGMTCLDALFNLGIDGTRRVLHGPDQGRTT